MLFIPTKELAEINKFVKVKVPSAREVFSRSHGVTYVPKPGEYTGDEYIPLYQSKTDAIAAADEEYREFLNKEEHGDGPDA